MPEAAVRSSQASHATADAVPHLSPHPPRWVDDLIGVPGRRTTVGALHIRASGRLAHLSISIANAAALTASALRPQVQGAYLALGSALARMDRRPIRFWNFVPGIGESMGSGLDRYMVFNAGRYDAYARWFGAPHASSSWLATASCVGVTGRDVFIHCLAADRPGRPVENPRQTPAWRYSSRYGPRPPCFCRATIATFDGQSRLLIGGTASILGEDSAHQESAGAQLEETLRNLEALIAVTTGAGEGPALDRMVDVRAYVVRAEDAVAVRSALAARCPRAARVELVLARLCRPELLVEIEGLAEI